MKVHYKDDTKEIYGYYDDTDTNIPEPNITITKEEWQEALNIQANFYNSDNGKLEYKDYRNDEEILNALKEEKIKEFHQKRDEKSIAEYEFEGHTYRMGLDVQQDILSTLTIFDKDNFIPNYTLKDIKTNEYIPFDYTKLQQLSREVAIRKATLIFKTQKLEDVINVCESKDELEAIEWK